MQELSLHILDLAQNSLRAGASLIGITVEESTVWQFLRICITDNGRGMAPEAAAKVADPFYTTRATRPVGMGVPLFKMAAEATGGNFSLQSEPGKGTEIAACFHTGHIDAVPLGDMAATLLVLIGANPGRDFVYCRRLDSREYTLDTRELKRSLGDVPLNTPAVLDFIRRELEEGHRALSACCPI